MTDPESVQERQAPASAPLLARPVVIPDPFGGDEGQQFKDWLANFELCAGLNAWNEDTRRKFLIVRFRGTAQEIYNNLDEATQTNYVQLKTAPIDQLDPAAQENRFRTEFRARRQRHGETIAATYAVWRSWPITPYPWVLGTSWRVTSS